MDLLYTTILDFINGLLPSPILADFQGLNELLAYFIVILLIWSIMIRPLLKLFKVVK